MRNLISLRTLLVLASVLGLTAAIACSSGDDAAAVEPAPAAETAPAPEPAKPAPAPEPVLSEAEKLGYTAFTAKVLGPDEHFTKIYTGPRPTKFTENPKIAELVKAGRPCGSMNTSYKDWSPTGVCPPLEERLPHPDDILIKNIPDEIGVHGGTKQHVEFNVSTLFHHATSFSLMENDYNTVDNFPHLAKGVEMSEDGRTFTVAVRRGVKWSDGKALDREDFEWVWEDLNYNKERYPKGFGLKDAITGNPVQFEMIDDSNFTLSFDTPNYTFFEGKFSGTPYLRGSGWFGHKPWWSQWVPKYQTPGELQEKLDAFGVEDWVKLIVKVGLHRVYSMPWIGPFFKPPNGELWNAGSNYNWRPPDTERAQANPFYFAVDPHGNQLPYVDAIEAQVLESREATVFRVMKGESDGPHGNGFQMGELPLYHENMEKGNISVGGRTRISGADTFFGISLEYNKDPEIGRLLRTTDFRVALSLAIDRSAINETAMLGLGVPQNWIPHPRSPYYPGKEWGSLNAVPQDMAAATALFEKMGYKKNSSGFFDRLDGTGPLTLTWDAKRGGMRGGNPEGLVSDLISSNWQDLGIKMVDPGGGQATSDFGKLESYLTTPWGDHYGHSPWWVDWGSGWPMYGDRGPAPCAGQYYYTGGEEGCTPTGGTAEFTDVYGNQAPAGTYAVDIPGIMKNQQDLLTEGKSVSFFDPRRKEIALELYKTNLENMMHYNTVSYQPFGIIIWRTNVRNVPTCCVGGYGDASITYFEDGIDNKNNPGNVSKKYKNFSFALN
jgi:ABC-type transport system substrate-binding protein